LVQNDIKRVLAYSTVSQLGYMFLGLGVGAFTAGIFHLMTHAFFKALLFLGSGSVIHALGGEQDIRKMGGLKGKIRTTWWTMLVGTIAIAGFPPLAGFFSKDEILWQAYASTRGHWGLWLVGAVVAGMTSFYMFRMMFLTFYGKSRMTAEVEHHVHESPGSMTVPLMVLALGSVVVGWVGVPHVLGKALGELPNGIERFLEPVFEHPVKLGVGQESETTEWLLMGVSVGLALLGLMLARSFYLKNPALPERLMMRYRALYTTLLNKYWVDEIYDALFVRPVKIASTYLLWKFCDAILIDGAVNGAAQMVRGGGGILRRLQSGSTRSYAAWILLGAVIVVFCFSFFGS
jgi:NADH-quinone oxidoreductase subunit L